LKEKSLYYFLKYKKFKKNPKKPQKNHFWWVFLGGFFWVFLGGFFWVGFLMPTLGEVASKFMMTKGNCFKKIFFSLSAV
jgi:hypothetical protein